MNGVTLDGIGEKLEDKFVLRGCLRLSPYALALMPPHLGGSLADAPIDMSDRTVSFIDAINTASPVGYKGASTRQRLDELSEALAAEISELKPLGTRPLTSTRNLLPKSAPRRTVPSVNPRRVAAPSRPRQSGHPPPLSRRARASVFGFLPRFAPSSMRLAPSGLERSLSATLSTPRQTRSMPSPTLRPSGWPPKLARSSLAPPPGYRASLLP
jgi:hypothetical protein